MKWKYLLGAMIFGGYCLFRIGAPLLPILYGCILAAVVTWLKRKNDQRRSQGQ